MSTHDQDIATYCSTREASNGIYACCLYRIIITMMYKKIIWWSSEIQSGHRNNNKQRLLRICSAVEQALFWTVYKNGS